MVFGKQSRQGYESNRRHADGVRVENIPGITTLAVLEKIQSLMKEQQCDPEQFKGRIIFMSMYSDIAWGEKEIKKDVNTIHRQLRIMLANSIAVIGLSWSLDQKRNGTELTLTNPTDHGINLQRTWWQISQDLVIQYFVPPVPLREENYGAKEVARSQYTPMVVMKTSSCFSAQ